MKKLLLKFGVGLTMQLSISGCFEFELGGGWGATDNWTYDSIFFVSTDPVDTTYHPAFFVDSISQIDKSTVTVWAHILYDTVLVINSRTAYSGYLEQPTGEGYRIVQSQPDTIDFRNLTDTTSVRNGRKERIYKYSCDFDGLRSGTTYWFCTINDYTEFITGSPVWRSEYKCSDYFQLK